MAQGASVGPRRLIRGRGRGGRGRAEAATGRTHGIVAPLRLDGSCPLTRKAQEFFAIVKTSGNFSDNLRARPLPLDGSCGDKGG